MDLQKLNRLRIATAEWAVIQSLKEKGLIKEPENNAKISVQDLVSLGFEQQAFNYYSKDSMTIKVWEDGSMSYGNADLETLEQLKLWYKGCTGKDLVSTESSLPQPEKPEQPGTFRNALKQALDELFEECKHGDQEHQDWLKNKFNHFVNNYQI